jgi:hypothetical protein
MQQHTYVRVHPQPEERLERDESIMKVTFHYQNNQVMVWATCDDDEQDECRLNAIIWNRPNPSGDW